MDMDTGVRANELEVRFGLVSDAVDAAACRRVFGRICRDFLGWWNLLPLLLLLLLRLLFLPWLPLSERQTEFLAFLLFKPF